MHAEAGSGIRFMSDSLIAFQPAIEEPSNIMPSEKVSSSIIERSKVTCCHLPRGSVKRKSAYLTSLSLINLRTSLAVVMDCIPFLKHGREVGQEVRPGPGRSSVQMASTPDSPVRIRIASSMLETK